MRCKLALTALLCLTQAAFANFMIFQTSKPSFIGFLDAYPNGATWGFSAYKLTATYAGNWGTVQRQSDNATQVLGFLTNGQADVATFNSFCSGTNCYAKQLVDQINGLNPAQNTLANMPRVIVNTNGNLAVCAQPTSSMTMAYSATVNTAKVHFFGVARQAFLDSRWILSGVPTYTITGNITASSTAVTAVSSQTGIVPGNGVPGVFDSAGFLPNSPTTGTTGTSGLAAFPTGSTATLQFQPGNKTTTGSQTGDTLTVNNATLNGAWLINGPASATFETSAYWGIGSGEQSNAATVTLPQNGSYGDFPNSVGQGMRDSWGVYDYDTFGGGVSYNAVNLGARSPHGNITYSTNVGMTLFSNANGTENAGNACFETMVLFPATQTSRGTMAQFLMTQSNLSFPFAPATSDGFTMTGVYQPNNFQGNATAYGAPNFGPDAFGLTWVSQTGGYTWPAAAFANNINNTATMWRFIIEQGDSDINITSNERTEINATAHFAPGNSVSIFTQVEFEQAPVQTNTGGWCDVQQIHYDNNSGNNAPDFFTIHCLNGQLQIQYNNSGGTTNCGSPLTLTAGTIYAFQIEITYSVSHTADALDVWYGTNGTSLTHGCTASGALFATDTGGYPKQGIYRGDPYSQPGTLIVRTMNYNYSAVANAFSSYRTTQPALPTHP
jgi:hypothetical protein